MASTELLPVLILIYSLIAGHSTALTIEQCIHIAEIQLDAILVREYAGLSCARDLVLEKLSEWCRNHRLPCANQSLSRCETAALRKAKNTVKRVVEIRPCVPIVPGMATTNLTCTLRVDFYMYEGHGDWMIGLSGNQTFVSQENCTAGCSKSLIYELQSNQKYEFTSRDISNAAVFPESDLMGDYQLYIDEEMFASGEVDAAEFVTFAVAPTSCEVIPIESPFSIHVIYDESVPSTFYPVFNEAALRWTSVINSSASVKEFELNGTRHVANDLLIKASFEYIDGLDNTLAYAQAGGFRSAFERARPYFGVIRVDKDDVEVMAELGVSPENNLRDVIAHEMGHILGIGVVWDGFLDDLTIGTEYIGQSAVEQFKSYGGAADATSFPLEINGGSGTAGSHWKESLFGKELMTGFINDGSNMLSRISIGFLADIGYSVNYAAADDYVIPLGTSLAKYDEIDILEDVASSLSSIWHDDSKSLRMNKKFKMHGQAKGEKAEQLAQK